MLRTTVAESIPVYAGNDHILQTQLGDGLRQVDGFLSIERHRPAVTDVAERAAAGADIPHDHAGGRTLAEAFTDGRARSFLAHRVQLIFPQNLFDFVISRVVSTQTHANPLRLAQRRSWDNLDRY